MAKDDIDTRDTNFITMDTMRQIDASGGKPVMMKRDVPFIMPIQKENLWV